MSRLKFVIGHLEYCRVWYTFYVKISPNSENLDYCIIQYTFYVNVVENFLVLSLLTELKDSLPEKWFFFIHSWVLLFFGTCFCQVLSLYYYLYLIFWFSSSFRLTLCIVFYLLFFSVGFWYFCFFSPFYYVPFHIFLFSSSVRITLSSMFYLLFFCFFAAAQVCYYYVASYIFWFSVVRLTLSSVCFFFSCFSIIVVSFTHFIIFSFLFLILLDYTPVVLGIHSVVQFIWLSIVQLKFVIMMLHHISFGFQ